MKGETYRFADGNVVLLHDGQMPLLSDGKIVIISAPNPVALTAAFYLIKNAKEIYLAMGLEAVDSRKQLFWFLGAGYKLAFPKRTTRCEYLLRHQDMLKKLNRTFILDGYDPDDDYLRDQLGGTWHLVVYPAQMEAYERGVSEAVRVPRDSPGTPTVTPQPNLRVVAFKHRLVGDDGGGSDQAS